MRLAKYLILFSAGGLIYLIIEILFRGYTHQSMFFVGGLCFVLIGLINEILDENTPIVIQMLLSSIIITTVEFVSGCFLNLVLNLNVWDYSDLWGNVLGQISLPFMVAWFFLSAAGILLDDILRHMIFQEKLPKYTIV
ncbi:MAG: hypothetical protein IJC41_02975 [Firmicutes bacterium]|nr:hypothetical protein [Clostridiales bacterium]MBQ4339944.1 hypothetical protein [Bacillota bacterium]